VAGSRHGSAARQALRYLSGGRGRGGGPAARTRDPADRIIVATARVLGGTLLTSDDAIVESELVPTLS